MEREEALRESIRDEEQLRVLRWCYLAMAAIHAFASLFGIVYMVFGSMMGQLMGNASRSGSQPPEFVGWLMGGLGCGFFVLFLAFAALNFAAARALKARRSKTLIYVAGAVACPSIPLGTILGVCTFIVLSRPSVDRLFGRSQSSDK